MWAGRSSAPVVATGLSFPASRRNSPQAVTVRLTRTVQVFPFHLIIAVNVGTFYAFGSCSIYLFDGSLLSLLFLFSEQTSSNLKVTPKVIVIVMEINVYTLCVFLFCCVLISIQEKRI